MTLYIVRRCVIALVLVWIVLTLIFAFLHLLPGDPGYLLLSGQSQRAPTPQQVADVDAQLGLNKPILIQYVSYLNGLIHGNLGSSFTDGHPVMRDVLQRLPRTVELILLSTLVSVIVGMPLGVWAATSQGKAPDVAVTIFTSAAISIPVFVIGVAFIYLLAVKLQWLPSGGYTAFAESPGESLKQAIMPVCALALAPLAAVARMTRSAVLDLLSQDWVRTARAKGLSRMATLRRHVVRNALNPVVTIVGLWMGQMIGGTVLVESVFNWPGISSQLVTGAQERDYPVVQGLVIIIATLFILLNLVVDCLYAVLDPTVEYR